MSGSRAAVRVHTAPTTDKEAFVRINDDLSSHKNTKDPEHISEDSQPIVGRSWQERLFSPGGQLVRGFEPTLYELQELVRYWYREQWASELFSTYHQTVGTEETVMVPYANKRLDRIGEAIGKKAYREVIAQVDAEIRKRIGEEDWAAITGHDKAAYEKLIARIEAELDEESPRAISSRTGGGPSYWLGGEK